MGAISDNMGSAALACVAALVLCLVSGTATAAPLVPVCTNATASSFVVSWTPSASYREYYVQLSEAADLRKPFALHSSSQSSVLFTGLAANHQYTVAVRGLGVRAPSGAWGPAWSDPAHTDVQCSTLKEDTAEQRGCGKSCSSDGDCTAPGACHVCVDGVCNVAAAEHSVAVPAKPVTKFMKVYRISEYSFDVDFLANHDSASVDAMPLYLMTCDPDGNCSPWDAHVQSPKWDSCHDQMSQVCPNSRGAAFNCMECADANREVLTAACGNFSDQDTLAGAGSFAVHWWCGVGWPESAAADGPITEYCVEYQPIEAPTRMGEGFSDYLSCNSDEVDGTLGNDPRDPSCICIVWDDRLLAHQSNESWLLEDCYVGHMAWLGEKPCNCTGQLPKSPLPHTDNPSVSHVGRMPVYLPYVGVHMKPYTKGDPQVQSGYNYHFPRAGQCADTQAIGTDGCTWKQLPQARMLYGDDLLAAGWDSKFVADTPTNQSHTLANVAAFKVALEQLSTRVKPMPCGP